MKQFSLSDLQSMERFTRANFINSLTGFKSASLIGSIDKSGNTNLGIFSSIVHIGSDPALVGYINRPRKAAPHTLSNIETTGVYTINHIRESFIGHAHQTSAKYQEGVSEFGEVGLTPEFHPFVTAPFVKESKVKYSLALKEIIPIIHNDTFFVIGAIQHIILDGAFQEPDGFLDLQKAGTICSNGIDSYYKTSFLARYAYAKPGKIAEILAHD